MKRIVASLLFLFVGCIGVSQARAADVYVSAYVSLRAGPYVDYPRLMVLSPGVRLVLYGCLDDWSWCDVSYMGDRGWVSANYLDLYYDGRRVLLPHYAVQLGLPVVVFSLPVYWSTHYRHRPWYPERARWERMERERRTHRVEGSMLPPSHISPAPSEQDRPAMPAVRSAPARPRNAAPPNSVLKKAPPARKKAPKKPSDHGGGQVGIPLSRRD